MTSPGCRLCLVTPPDFDPDAFASILEQALDGGDVACLRLSLTADDTSIRRAAQLLLPITQKRDIAFLLTDHPALAAEVEADGVHLTRQGGMTVAEARRSLGDGAIIGVECGTSRHLAMEAGSAGADYVGFGLFYTPATNELEPNEAEKTESVVDLVSWWAEIFELPCVALGEITAENCRPLLEASADFLEAGTSLWTHPLGPAAAVSEFCSTIEASRRA